MVPACACLPLWKRAWGDSCMLQRPAPAAQPATLPPFPSHHGLWRIMQDRHMVHTCTVPGP